MNDPNDKDLEMRDFYDKLTASLPVFFARNAVDELTGKLFTGRYLSNLMAKKQGPIGRRIGNKVVIFRDDFASWLKSRYNSAV